MDIKKKHETSFIDHLQRKNHLQIPLFRPTGIGEPDANRTCIMEGKHSTLAATR